MSSSQATSRHTTGGTRSPAALRQVDAYDPARGGVADVASPPLVTAANTAQGRINYGDRLKITFFETLDVPPIGNNGGPNQAAAAVFPRMDLSAEYAVDGTGSVNIPKLGQFTIVGQTIAALQSGLAASFKRTIGRPGDVHVAIVDQQPIYVLGSVRNAGAFKYTPGMIVLQALADAGGNDGAVADTSRAIESIRETERLRQEEEKLDHLLVRQARLIAQQNNANSIELPADMQSRLAATKARDGLDKLIAGEAATLTIETRSHQQQLALAARQVEIARVELEAEKMRAGQLKALQAKKEDKLHELTQIAAHGSVSQYKLTDASVDISELVARQEDLRVAMAQSERRLVESELAQSKLELDYSAGLEKELVAAQQDINDSVHAIASMQAVTQVLRNGGADLLAGANVQGLRITRRLPNGITIITATETTSLLPGDVVEVGAANHADTPPHSASIAGQTGDNL